MWRQKLEEAARMLAADIKKNRYALLIIAAYLLLKKFFLHSTCPFVMLAGLPCPACGLTRAGIALLCGNVKMAWELHPFIYVAVMWSLFFFIWKYLLKREVQGLKKYAVATLVGLVGYYVFRMIMYFPGEEPMSYYYDNLLADLWRIAEGMVNAKVRSVLVFAFNLHNGVYSHLL